MKISIKLKITFSIVLLVIVMMGIVTYIFTIRELNLRVDHMKQRMEQLASHIATIRSVETEDWDVYQTYIDNQLKLNPEIVYIAVLDDRNQLKIHALNTDWIDLSDDQIMDRWEQASIVWRLDQRQLAEESQRDMESKSVNIISGGNDLGVVKVGFSLVDLNDEMRSNLYRNLNLALIFIVLGIIVSFIISQRILTPLGKLTKAMHKISLGDLRQELDLQSRDEIGEMAETFNYMTKGLKDKALLEDFSRILSTTFEFKKITRLITERISLALNAKQCFLFIRDPKDKYMYHLTGSHPEPVAQHLSLTCPHALYEFLLAHRHPKQLEFFKEHIEFYEQLPNIADMGRKAILAPVLIQNSVQGLFLLDSHPKDIPYSEDEKKFLSTLIGQSCFAIENTILLEELTKRERLQQELEIARTVQQNLLPQHEPKMPGMEIDGICIPAKEVGGDYYDYFRINDRTLGVVVADVSGKGVSASFYMAVVKGMMLSLSSILTSPKQLLIELNRRLYEVMDRNMFVTMSYATIDTKKKILTLSRAGHNALLMRDTLNSDTQTFTPSGIGLGLEKGTQFNQNITEQRIHYKFGDVFLFYTDGISEAMNIGEEAFGEHRLIDFMNQLDHQSAIDIRKKMIRTVNNFVKDAPQHDDLTMVILRMT